MIAVRVIAAAFLIAGLGLLAAGAAAYRETQAFLGASATAQGTVIEVHRHRSAAMRGKTHEHHVYEVRFTPLDGEPVTTFAGEDSTAEYQAGDAVTLRYVRDSPRRAQIDAFRYVWFKFTLLTVMGLAALVMGMGNLWLAGGRGDTSKTDFNGKEIAAAWREGKLHRDSRFVVLLTAMTFALPPIVAGMLLFILFGNVVVQAIVFAILAWIAFQIVRDKRRARP